MNEDIQSEMASLSTAYESLYDRYVQALGAIDEWEKKCAELEEDNKRLESEADAISASCTSMHNRWVAASADVAQLKDTVESITNMNEQLRRERDSYINRIHAAHDNG